MLLKKFLSFARKFFELINVLLHKIKKNKDGFEQNIYDD